MVSCSVDQLDHAHPTTKIGESEVASITPLGDVLRELDNVAWAVLSKTSINRMKFLYLAKMQASTAATCSNDSGKMITQSSECTLSPRVWPSFGASGLQAMDL